MRVPSATYRLQMNHDCTFHEVTHITEYLYQLGITDLYLSPILRAMPGSTHGYDVIDHSEINPEIGTAEDLKQLASLLAQKNMGILLDIVPNHMAFSGENRYIIDIFENGHYSQYYHFFDVNWNHTFESINGKIIAPFLGKFYGECLENCELVLKYDEFGFSVNYYTNRFSLKIDSYLTILTYKQYRLKNLLGKDHPEYIKFFGLLYAIKNLPSEKEDFQERYDQVRFIKGVLWELYTGSPTIRKFVDENIAEINGEKGIPQSFNTLDALLSAQVFRLAYWKVATDEINYRRFFNVNGLISLREEDEVVFNKAHNFIIDLMIKGDIQGLRIDHIDGLYDPAAYLQRLKSRTNDGYVIVEKILEDGESLPENWDCEGTVGYDFLNYVNGIFIKKINARVFSRIYHEFTGFETVYDEMLYEKKRLMLTRHMSGDMDNIARILKRIASYDRYASDYTFSGLKMALEELIILFPVYRSYVNGSSVSLTDRAIITKTVERAERLNPSLVYELNFIKNILLLQYSEANREEVKKDLVDFIMKFQQYTGPLMAKGLEDTLFYSYNLFLSLNEVGGNPGKFGVTVKEFHKYNKERVRRTPYAMNTTSTHDTKRGEDLRARLNVLSEIPVIWEKNVKRWHKQNRKYKKIIQKAEYPDRNDEYFIYQILVASYPFIMDDPEQYKLRIKEYLIKAVRESKNHTNWLKPESVYEEAILKFLDCILEENSSNLFISDFKAFVDKIIWCGALNSLSQLILKLFSPGVPDLYQGSEFWELSLVDPDNRRPVDFEVRRDALEEIAAITKSRETEALRTLYREFRDGRIKMYYLYSCLHFRQEHDALLRDGTYLPLELHGKFREHFIAFMRMDKAATALVIVSRFHSAFTAGNHLLLSGTAYLKGTFLRIPETVAGEYQDLLTGTRVMIKTETELSEVLTMSYHGIFIKL